jgi:branched-chain amino acid transport system substrate-binding protein
VNPWVLHAFGTAPQVTYPLGDYAAQTLGYKRMAIVAEDFTYGHEGAGGFHLAFEAAGGKIVQKLWPPLNAPDYAPYLAQIKPDLDGIYMGFAGSNPLRFLKQLDDYALKGKIGVLGNTTSTDEGILKLMGRRQSILSAPVGTPPASIRRTTRNSSPASTRTINMIPVSTRPVLTRRFSS